MTKMTSDRAVFRMLTADDAPAFWEIRQQALTFTPEAFAHSPSEETYETCVTTLRLSESDAFVLGMFNESLLVGVAGFYRDKRRKCRHKAWICGVFVCSEYRQLGFGKALLNGVIERARELKELESIRVSVATTQTAALRLYSSLGFESFGVEQGALKIENRYIDEEYMVLHLCSRSA